MNDVVYKSETFDTDIHAAAIVARNIVAEGVTGGSKVAPVDPHPCAITSGITVETITGEHDRIAVSHEAAAGVWRTVVADSVVRELDCAIIETENIQKYAATVALGGVMSYGVAG